MSGHPQNRTLMLRLASRELIGTATISRGGYPVATGVSCQATTNQLPQETLIAGELRAVVRWLIRLPIATDVRSTDQIAIDGRTFEVIAPVEPVAGAIERLVQAVEQ